MDSEHEHEQNTTVTPRQPPEGYRKVENCVAVGVEIDHISVRVLFPLNEYKNRMVDDGK